MTLPRDSFLVCQYHISPARCSKKNCFNDILYYIPETYATNIGVWEGEGGMAGTAVELKGPAYKIMNSKDNSISYDLIFLYRKMVLSFCQFRL